MKKFEVGIILSTTYEVEATDEEEAEEIAKDLAEEDYFDLNIEESNFVREIENDADINEDNFSCEEDEESE